MHTENLAMLGCEGVTRYLGSVSAHENPDDHFEELAKKHFIERRQRAERRLCRERDLWENHRAGERRDPVPYYLSSKR